MSLINDADYLIHILRLTYLRHIDDPYGPRVISLDPRYSYNPHITAAGLSDLERWPELSIPTSPQPTTETDHDRDRDRNQDRRTSVEQPLGVWPGATGLKYTQTIRGSRTALAAGMSVSGRRYSGSKASPLSAATIPESKLQRLRADSAPTPVTVSPKPPVAVHITAGSPESAIEENLLQRTVHKRGSVPASVLEADLDEGNDRVVEKANQNASAALFAPRFARGAEMEARRLQRIRARRSSGYGLVGGQQPRAEGVTDLSSGAIPENSLIDEEDEEEEDDTEDEDVDGDGDEGGDLQDQDDEFEGNAFLNPPFAPPTMTSNGSDALSLLSANSALSTSHSSAFASSLQVTNSTRSRNRLSPVHETQGAATSGQSMGTAKAAIPMLGPDGTRRLVRSHSTSRAESTTAQRTLSEPIQVKSPPANKSDHPITPDPTDSTVTNTNNSTTGHRHQPRSRQIQVSSKPSLPTFSRKKVLPVSQQQTSALTKLLASQSSTSSNNPFTSLYAAISGRADPSTSITLQVYFPHSRTQKSKPLELKVRKDATVEEVIGFGLWSYWDAGCEPKLDEGLGGEDDPKREIRLGAVGWNLRIVEEDGEVDEDFPALDRTRPISKFSFEEFAICEAIPSQVQQNKVLEAKILRRPSRLMVSKASRPSELSLAPSSTAVSASALTSSALSVVPSAVSNPSNSTSPLIFLRVRVAESADASYYSTTISVPLDMYMAEVLEIVCRKRRLPTNPKDWVLLLDDMSILIPLDRTVASLQGNWNLVMIKRSLADQLDAGKGKKVGKSTDPNASIFEHGPGGGPDGDTNFATAYKKYTVHRKVPMLVGRHERMFAIDRDYIHIMPSGTKAFLDSMKTSSYHIRSIHQCAQSKSGGTAFKLIVHRDSGNKRYDFEADTPELAAEIVATVKQMQKLLDRSSTVHKSKSRRPRSTATVK